MTREVFRLAAAAEDPPWAMFDDKWRLKELRQASRLRYITRDNVTCTAARLQACAPAANQRGRRLPHAAAAAAALKAHFAPAVRRTTRSC